MSDRHTRTDLSVPDWFTDRIRLFMFKVEQSGCLCIASNHKSTLDMENDPVIKDFIKDKQYVHIPMSFVVNDCESMEHAYLFINADCAFPPHYVVFADSEDDALGIFLSETDTCLVEEPDLSDYEEDDLDYDDNGRPMDTSSLLVVILKPVMAIFA
jgi:hypothetical protein